MEDIVLGDITTNYEIIKQRSIPQTYAYLGFEATPRKCQLFQTKQKQEPDKTVHNKNYYKTKLKKKVYRIFSAARARFAVTNKIQLRHRYIMSWLSAST